MVANDLFLKGNQRGNESRQGHTLNHIPGEGVPHLNRRRKEGAAISWIGDGRPLEFTAVVESREDTVRLPDHLLRSQDGHAIDDLKEEGQLVLTPPSCETRPTQVINKAGHRSLSPIPNPPRNPGG